ncbi:Inositol-pentakisphosphate 2-kinase family protein [Euphorbia peplus]|nr:Inositol-pentakisphosphate 2-kinase family protein [Euphorbia peplus]
MEVVKFELNHASDWEYRGEGAVNLVLAYTGSSPLFIGKVMRILKVAKKSEQELTDEEILLWKVHNELVSAPTKEFAQLIYVKNVISPLLGPEHVDPGIHVPVSKEFLDSIEKKVTSQRPASRVEAAKIDTQCDYGLLMSDHSLFPPGKDKVGSCISVEIKPKCGFLPESRFIAERNAIKKRITRFRMHQVLKLQKHEVSELSRYDPLDIFSDSKKKIRKAVNDLFITPQNNFRVFLNGTLILGGLGGSTIKTSTLVEEAFEDALKGVIKADDGLRTTSFLELIAETLYNSKVLHRLVEAQKLDYYDIEGAIHVYYDIISQPCMVCKELDGKNLQNTYSSLHSIPMDEKLKIVRDYLISATAKDCSLMISFRPKEDGSPYGSVYLQPTGQNFDYKVNFLDLDLKSSKKMVEYYQNDKKIVDLYVQTEEKQNHVQDKISSTK